MNIWVYRLSLFPVLWLALRTVTTKEIVEIRYLYGDQLPVNLLRWALRLRRQSCSIRKAQWSLGAMSDPTGMSLRYAIEEATLRVVSAVRSEILSGLPLLQNGQLSQFPREWVEAFLLNTLYVGTRERLKTLALADQERRTSPTQGSSSPIIVLLPAHLTRPYILRERFACNLRVEWYGGAFRVAGGLLQQIGRELLAYLRDASRSLVQVMRVGTEWAQQSPAGERIGLQYCWECDPSRRSDLYWWQGSGIPAERILFYFDRPDRALTHEIATEIRTKGFGLVVRDPAATRLARSDGWQPPAYFGTDLLRAAAILVISSRVRRAAHLAWTFWALGISLSLLRQALYWSAFFRQHRIRIHMNHSGEVGNLHLAQSLGMHLAGGVNVRSSYSYHAYLLANWAREFHVFFDWGPNAQCGPYVGKPDAYLCRITVGYIFDYLFEEMRARREILRRPLEANGARFVVAVYDHAFGDEFQLTEAMVSELYSSMAELVLQDQEIGLLIKPRRFTRADLVHLVPQMNEAFATGRCRILSHDESPVVAAAGADVGLGLGYSSAVIEATLFGVRGVHWVPYVLPCPQLQERADAPIVFSDLKELIRAMREYRRNGGSFGDHSIILPDIDPWRDGRAGQRVGTYLSWLLEAFEGGYGRDRALTSANGRYAERWGVDRTQVHLGA